MQATITQNKDRGRGHGIIVVSDLPGLPDPMSFTIQRSQDMFYLAENGRWRNSVECLDIKEYSFEQGILYIAVGPKVIDQLDTLASCYHMTIGNNRNSFVLNVPSDMPQGRMPTRGGAGEPIPPVQETNVVNSDALVNEPLPADPEPISPPQPEPNPIQDEPITLDPPKSKPKPKADKGKIIKTALMIMVMLALVGAGLWMFFNGKGNTVNLAQEPIHQPDIPLEPRAPVVAESDGNKPFLDQARAQLRLNPEASVSVSLARPLRVAGASEADSDGAFLLLEDAAEKGNTEAMYLLAQYYDPLSKLPRGTIQVDIEQAYNWYKRAASGGVPQATEALNALYAEVERQAHAGNSDALRILRQW